MTLTTYMDLEQRSDEWLKLRCGMVTASIVGQLVTTKARTAADFDCSGCGSLAGFPCQSKRTGGPIATLHPERTAAAKADTSPPVLTLADNETVRGVAAFLAAERIAGIDPDSAYMTNDMFRGVMAEAPARAKYSEHHGGIEVVECGFMVLEQDGYSIGYSPDGLVGGDGLLEIKSPRQKTHVLTVVDGEVPAAHMAQIQTGLLVSGRSWCDFISYSPGLRMWPKRVLPDPAWFGAINAAARGVERVIEQLLDDYEAATRFFPMTERLDLDTEITV
jgi:hypothetical protein